MFIWIVGWCIDGHSVFRHEITLGIAMITVNLKVVQEEKYGYAVHFDAEFEGLSSQQKLDLLQDAVYELNKKWVEVDENYQSSRN